MEKSAPDARFLVDMAVRYFEPSSLLSKHFMLTHSVFREVMKLLPIGAITICPHVFKMPNGKPFPRLRPLRDNQKTIPRGHFIDRIDSLPAILVHELAHWVGNRALAPNAKSKPARSKLV